MVNYNTKVDTVRIADTSVGYDAVNDMYKISSMQKKFRDSFTGASLDTTKWTSSIGTGGSITVSGGIASIISGTTINAETSIVSVDVFTVPFKLSLGLGLSQRIANQTFYVEAISVDPVTKVPDGKHSCGLIFDGTTATTNKYRVQNGGLAPLDSGAVAFPTTVGTVSCYEIEPFGDEVWFHGGTLDSVNGRANSYRRHQQIPDPNALYKIRLRWLNGGTAPASTSTATLQYVACQDYAELTAEITAGRGQTAVGQGIGVNVVSMPTTTITGTVSVTTPTNYNVDSLATTNGANVKATAGTLFTIVATNTNASTRYLKIYNLAVAPTVGTSVPFLDIPLPSGQTTGVNLGNYGIRLGTGISVAITGGAGNTDATAIGVSEVKVVLSYV